MRRGRGACAVRGVARAGRRAARARAVRPGQPGRRRCWRPPRAGGRSRRWARAEAPALHGRAGRLPLPRRRLRRWGSRPRSCASPGRFDVAYRLARNEWNGARRARRCCSGCGARLPDGWTPMPSSPSGARRIASRAGRHRRAAAASRSRPSPGWRPASGCVRLVGRPRPARGGSLRGAACAGAGCGRRRRSPLRRVRRWLDALGRCGRRGGARPAGGHRPTAELEGLASRMGVHLVWGAAEIEFARSVVEAARAASPGAGRGVAGGPCRRPARSCRRDLRRLPGRAAEAGARPRRATATGARSTWSVSRPTARQSSGWPWSSGAWSPSCQRLADSVRGRLADGGRVSMEPGTSTATMSVVLKSRRGRTARAASAGAARAGRRVQPECRRGR